MTQTKAMPQSTAKDAPENDIFRMKDPHPERAVVSDPAQAVLNKKLEKGLQETFPASDPPAVTQATTIGREDGLEPATEDEVAS